MEELWDIARVAAYLGVSERTVYNRVRAGELPAIKVGRLWRVRPSALEAWLTRDTPAACVAGAATESHTDVPGPYPYASVTERLPILAQKGAPPTRAALAAAVNASRDPLTRRLAFVAALTRGVEVLGWSAPVVVGGHAVEFYTAGGYATQDIDLAGASEPVAHVLESWGFAKQGRHWYDDDLGIVVEVPGSSLDSDQCAHVVSVAVGGAIAYVLGIEDLIVDRLAACEFWRDEESCRWAKVLLRSASDIDTDYLLRRVREEGLVDAFAELGGWDPS